MLVSITIGLMVTGLTLSSSLINRYSISKDIARTRLNQNVRGAIDMIGLDVRVTGENLTSSFPAIEVIDAVSGSSDRLILRRNLLAEVLPLCTAISAGSTVTQIIFARTTATPGCSYAGQTHNYNTWQNYRVANGGTVKAFIFDAVLRRGEFFTYRAGVSTGTQYELSTNPITWQYSYAVGTSAVYMLEEWEYRKEGELITLIENRETADPYNIAFGANSFNVNAILDDDSSVASFSETQNWTTLSAVEISLTGTEQFMKKPMLRTLTGRFFPRNILSN